MSILLLSADKPTRLAAHDAEACAERLLAAIEPSDIMAGKTWAWRA